MSRQIATKAELLALIERGPTAVAAIHGTNTYRVNVPEDADPKGGIWMSLSPAPKYVIEKYETAMARVGGRRIRLTKAEARERRGVIAATMRMRARPWHFEPATRRRSSLRQSPRGASNGGKMGSPMGSTDTDESENAA